MRYLGLDLGSKTLGVAISDKLGIIANPLDVIRYNNYEDLFNELDKIIENEDIKIIVLGNPINMNGSISNRSIETLEFKKLLENKYNIEVIMQDERLSTIEAEKVLIDNGARRNNRKKVIDKLAATIILQTYLDRK